MLRDASGLHVQPVSYLTGSDRIARAGQKNVWDKVSCGPVCAMRHNLNALLDPGVSQNCRNVRFMLPIDRA